MLIDQKFFPRDLVVLSDPKLDGQAEPPDGAVHTVVSVEDADGSRRYRVAHEGTEIVVAEEDLESASEFIGDEVEPFDERQREIATELLRANFSQATGLAADSDDSVGPAFRAVVPMLVELAGDGGFPEEGMNATLRERIGSALKLYISDLSNTMTGVLVA